MDYSYIVSYIKKLAFCILGVLALTAPVEVLALNDVSVGVLFGGLGSNNHTERNETSGVLSFPEWKERWPYFTVIRNSTTIQIDQDDQRVMDQEIKLASTAGLNYWVFEGMPINEGAVEGLDLYMKSSLKGNMKFALMISGGRLAEDGWETKYVPLLVKYLSDPQYLRVKNQQPLLYIMTFDRMVESLGEVVAKQRMADFKAVMKTQLGANLYLSLVDIGSQNASSKAKSYLFSARSSYLGGAGGVATSSRGGPYGMVADGNANYWNTFLGSDLDYIPTVVSGIDPRPKNINAAMHDWSTNPPWALQGTPDEIALQVKRAVNWVRDNPKVATGKTLMISHWSSMAEGQWLVPTLDGGNARLNAISKVLGGQIMATPKSPYIDNPLPLLPINPVVLNPPILDGATLLANKPIKISGSADLATRMTVSLGPSKFFFINVKGGDGGNNFSIELPALPPGGPYNLTIRGDVVPLTIRNIMMATTLPKSTKVPTVSSATPTLSNVFNLLTIVPTKAQIPTSFVTGKPTSLAGAPSVVSVQNNILEPSTVKTLTNTTKVVTVTSSGDSTGDGKIDLVDFSKWKTEYLKSLSTTSSDFNKDGKVDLVDFGLWKSAYLK